MNAKTLLAPLCVSTLLVLLLALFSFSSFHVADAQIIVLGMHHSGTSAVTKMITMMGAKAGSDDELIVSSLKEFYERKDVVELNDLLFQHAAVYEHNKRPTWVGYGFSPSVLEAKESLLENFRERAERIIVDHLSQSGRTWVTKDPRMSLTAKYWLDVYDNLVRIGKIPEVEATCVVVHRDLFPMMKTLWKWSNEKNNGLNAEEWLDAWNAYMLSIGDACANRKIVLVRNVDSWNSEEYFDNFQNLYTSLNKTYSDLQQPSKEAIRQMASGLKTPRLHISESESYRAQVMQPVLGHLTTELIRKIEDGKLPIPEKSFAIESCWADDFSSPESIAQVFQTAPTSFLTKITKSLTKITDGISNTASRIFTPAPVKKSISKEAYVTLITGDNPLYMGLALTLAHSIRKHDQQRDIVALLVEDSVSKDWEPLLQAVGYKVKYVETIPEPWLGNRTIEKCHAPQDLINRWGKLMTKLQTFALVEYEKVIFLDSDIIMVSPADSVFKIKGFGGGAGNFGRDGLFNAGYMLLEPSKKTLKKISRHAARSPPRLFNNILDCTEMGLLNKFYHKHMTLLPMASPYNVVNSPFIHWFGDHKPWENLDTTCYPSPYFANKLWAQTWTETVESLKEFTGNELFQNTFKAVMDRRAQPSQLHNDQTVVYDKKRISAYDSRRSSAYDFQRSAYPAYDFKPSHSSAYLEEEESAYFNKKNSFAYLDEKRSTPFAYLEEERSAPFAYMEEKESAPFSYLEEEQPAPFAYMEEKQPASFAFLKKKKPSSFIYVEEK